MRLQKILAEAKKGRINYLNGDSRVLDAAGLLDGPAAYFDGGPYLPTVIDGVEIEWFHNGRRMRPEGGEVAQ
jgi:hypothetical protein